jgi:sulfoxide reductase heme-binding subunit YedZ
MSVTKLKFIVFFISLMPLAWMSYGVITDNLGANPIEAVTRESGLWALRFLILTLLVTPIRWFSGFNLIPIRRMLGLYVFFYATLHMLLYLWLDQFFDVSEIIKDIIKRPFITIGFISYLCLLPLAVTSNQAMIKKLGGRRWKMLHQLTYVILVISCLHFYMLVKLDKLEPIIYAVISSLVLAPRLYRYVQSKQPLNPLKK